MALLIATFPGLATVARAQFLRLGPFDVDASTSLNFIYTTNVDGQRESDSVRDREDFYLVWSLSAVMAGPTTPTSDLTLNTATSIEKHFIRDDLDRSSDPFANVTLTHNMELGRFELPTVMGYRRQNTQDADGTTRIFIPGQRSDRVVQDSRFINQGLNWSYEPFSINASYNYLETRFEDEEFQDGDENRHSLSVGAAWDVIRWGGERRLTAFYSYSRRKTELINIPADERSGVWETTESAGLRLQILTRPDLSYALAARKDDEGDWRPTHTFAISDMWELSSVLTLDANARYVIDQQARDDDIRFVYSVGLTHDVGETLTHNIRAVREPVNTFGSTTDSDSTSVSYNISKTDLFFANITFNGSIRWQQNKPQGEEAGPTEETTTYQAGLAHSTLVSRRLSRSLSYSYRYQTSNFDDEPVIEHRVILGFTFTF